MGSEPLRSSENRAEGFRALPGAVDYSRLFTLDDPLASRSLRLDLVDPDWPDDDMEQCLFKGECQPSRPIGFKGYKGGQPADFLWTSLPPLVCVSERVVTLLEQNCLTGWSTYPVEVHDRKGAPLPGYHGFAVKSWAGERDLSRSPIIQKPPIVPGGKPYEVYKGIYFDESKWDGSDIFRVGYAIIIVTQRLRDIFVKAKVTNVRFNRVTEEEWDVFDYQMGKGK